MPGTGGWDQKILAKSLADGQLVTALIDNGAQMNMVTPSFVRQCGLKVGSINDLNRHRGRIPVSCSGVPIRSPSDMFLSEFNFPESPHMMKSRWPWSFEMGVSSASESPLL